MGVTSSLRKSLTEPLFIDVDRCRMHLSIPLSSWMHWKLLVLHVTPLGATEISVLQLDAITDMYKNILWSWVFSPSFSLINHSSLRFLLLSCLHCLHSTLPSCLLSLGHLPGVVLPVSKMWIPRIIWTGTVGVRHFLLQVNDCPRHCYHSPRSILFFFLFTYILGIETVLIAGIPWRIL